MFDRYGINPVVHQGPTTIHEHRAPTDASVRLLREMEDKARENIIRSFPLPSNTLQGVVHQQHNIAAWQDNYLFVFSLNGKEHRVRIDVNGGDDPVTKIIEKLSTYLAQEIAANLCNGRAA